MIPLRRAVAIVLAMVSGACSVLAPAPLFAEPPQRESRLSTEGSITLADTACPDLQATGIRIEDPPSLFPGQVIGASLSVTMTIGYVQGGIVAPEAVLYISSDSVITRTDRPLTGGSRLAIDYDVTSDSTLELALKIPRGVAVPQFSAGPAYIGVIVDDFNAVAECNEENNSAAVPVTIVPASEAPTIPTFLEQWTNGIDSLLWLTYGEPEPKSTVNRFCEGAPAVDPKGDGSCYSGLWMKDPVAWGIGSRLTFRFATNVLGSRRSPNSQSLRIGLCGGWDPSPSCEGPFGPVTPRLWANVNMATEGIEEIVFLADGIGVVAPPVPYPATMDTTCHTLSFLGLTDGGIRVDFDGVRIGSSTAEVPLSQPLFIFIDGQSVDITNVVSEIELAPGIVSPTLLEFPTTPAGDVATLPLGIWNPDTLPLPIDSIVLGTGPFALIPAFAESLEAGLEVPPGARIETQVLFAPLDGGNHDTRAVLFSGGDTLTTLPVRGKSIGLDFSWNNPEDYDPREITQGERVRIKVQLGDAVEVDSVVLHSSEGQIRAYESVAMTRIEDPFTDRARYQGTIAGEKAGASGVRFYVSAHNGSAVSTFRSAEAPELLRVRVRSLNFEGLQPSETYAMISIPLEVPDTRLVDLLGDDLGDESLWRMFAYDRRAESYEEIHLSSDNIARQGEAYWLIKRGPLALDLPGLFPITMLSTPLDSAFSILLSPGWNMISTPFAMAVAWDSCRIDGVLTPVAEGAGTVGPAISWDWSQSAYLDSTEFLWPFQGFWVFNQTSAAVTLSIPPIPEETFSTEDGGNERAKRADAPPEGWRLRIIASAAGSRDGINIIGASAEADAGWDPLDRAEPPLSPGEAIALHFPHDDWGPHAGRYTADIREDRIPTEWVFDVAHVKPADQPDLVTLHFSGLETLPGDLDVILTDRVLGRELDVRLSGEYQFVSGRRDLVASARDCRFALRVAKRSAGEDALRAPDRDWLFANVPNPFNPATVIHYDVAEAGHVRLTVFDAAGRLVRTLFAGPRSPGRYEAVWNGKDDREGEAPSGIYICRMERGSVRSSVRMVLLR